VKESISLELLLSNEVCRLLDGFATLMKIQVVFFSAQGEILKRGRDFGNCDYCRRMQERYFSLEKCRRLDREMQQSCRESGNIRCYRCHAGLNEMIAPIRILGEVAGFIMLGQFRTTRELPAFLAGDAEAQKEFLALPYFAPEGTGSLEDMARMLIDYIVGKELVTYSGSLRYRRILHYLDRHLTEKITLQQLARHLGISESALTHFLRNEHRTSFKRLLTQKRLEAAEALWKDNPTLTVSEAAFRVGYEDHHYFSRIYRQERGYPPGKFKKPLGAYPSGGISFNAKSNGP